VVGTADSGLAARKVVFCVIGLFIIQAARQFDSSEARGLGEAFDALPTAQRSLDLGVVAVCPLPMEFIW